MMDLDDRIWHLALREVNRQKGNWCRASFQCRAEDVIGSFVHVGGRDGLGLPPHSSRCSASTE